MNWWQLFRALLKHEGRITKLEKQMSETTDEIATIKADFTAKWQSATEKILALEAAMAGSDAAAIQAALDDLKATVSGAALPA